ncbi:hypothetical protein EYF80_033948 [Liparis tanakae]|uniref:Uncharacterized protein n=1 Tax=Liparis tanakae TaxID=230148 RepID=A0A4Z2GRJ0_9TELE|nr:hypothetical protein EYF80_033948 [Liparis tanakae]
MSFGPNGSPPVSVCREVGLSSPAPEEQKATWEADGTQKRTGTLLHGSPSRHRFSPAAVSPSAFPRGSVASSALGRPASTPDTGSHDAIVSAPLETAGEPESPADGNPTESALHGRYDMSVERTPGGEFTSAGAWGSTEVTMGWYVDSQSKSARVWTSEPPVTVWQPGRRME